MNIFLYILLFAALIVMLALIVVSVRSLLVKQRALLLWETLTTLPPSTGHPTTGDEPRFDASMLADLPEPVQRYLRHAIAADTPLERPLVLDMTGEIKLKEAWYPFTGQEVISADGFLWKASLSMNNLPVHVFDSYYHGSGDVRVFIGPLLMLHQSNPDVNLSAAGRLAIELLWSPTNLLPRDGLSWEADDPHHISATIHIDNTPHTITFVIDDEGRLCEGSMQRWNGDEQQYDTFGFRMEEEETFGGLTVPSRGEVGWWYGTERYETAGKFFTFSLEHARLLPLST
jgi:hypothetical protein